MRFLSSLLLILLALLALIFSSLNAQSVTINYYLGSDQLPLSLFTFLIFMLGGLLGLMTAFIAFIKLKYSCRRLQNRLNRAEKELANLRSLPLKDPH